MSLRPFVSDNLLQISRGRWIGQSFLPFYSKHQIILSKYHPLSELLLQGVYVKNCHSGRNLTLSFIWKMFWIVDAKPLIRNMLLDCDYCKHQRVLLKPFLMNELPIKRLSSVDKSFTHTGIDSFGPLLVKLNRRTWANKAEAKRYGATFMCLSLSVYASNWQICQLTVTF